MKVIIILFLLVFFATPSYATESPAVHSDQKNAAAQDDTAGMYFWGYGVKRDYAQAMKFWRKAADLGDAIAPFNIGAMYEDGWGVKRDYAEAVKWYLKAAGLGNAKAQRNIGRVYAGGWGVTQDPEEAVKWYRKAALQGDYIADLSLGGMYERGEGGLKQDYIQAYMWLSLAAAAKNEAAGGNSPAIVETFDLSIVGYAAKQRDELAAKMTPEQIAEGKRLAAARKQTPFQTAVPAATVADTLENGKVAFDFHDYQTAVKLMLPLVGQGNVGAQEKIGTLYANGQDGVNRDYAQAMFWYQSAAERGDARAQADIGWMYENGWGVKRDYAEAAKWYRKAADQGDYIAQFSIGGRYEHGVGGLKQDYTQAYMWLSLAAAARRDAAKYDFTIVDNYDSSIVEYAAKQRDALAAIMTPEQIAEAKRLAASWKQTPALAAAAKP
jgi:TPR repeat protein